MAAEAIDSGKARKALEDLIARHQRAEGAGAVI